MILESCLKLLEHDVVEISLCHLGRFANPGYWEQSELHGPWQGLGQISLLQTEMAPSFLLDNTVEFLMATEVWNVQTGVSVLAGLDYRLFHFMGWNTIPKQHTCNCIDMGWCWEHKPLLV
jgi:hypothetical protein